MYVPKPNPPFEQYLLEKAASIFKRSQAAEDARAYVSVALARRFRGNSASDRFGFFSPDPNSNAWLGDHREDTEALANMKFLPVVKPAVKANLSAMVTASVKCTVEPAITDPAIGGVAAVAKGVYEFLDGHEDHWSDMLEGRVNSLVQLSHGCFVRSRHNPHKIGEQTTEIVFGEEEMPVEGEYACAECGAGGPLFEGVTRDGEMATTVCPECGGTAEVVSEPSSEIVPVPTGTTQRNTGDSETTVHTAYEVRVDERRTQGGNLRAARWMEYHYLQPREELEAENPGFDIGEPEQWSFPLMWQHALESGTDQYLKMGRSGWGDCDIYEAREIYLLPEDYATHREPAGAGYALRDGDGEVVFEIKPGERLIDKFPRGFRFKLAGQKILPGTKKSPNIEEYDFRNHWTYMGFSPDGFSFWMPPVTELLTLQDDINTLYTIDFQHRERNSIVTTAYDRMAFDAEDFEQELAPTKEGFTLEANDSLDRHVKVLPGPQMQQAMQGLEFLFGIAPQVGAPPPAASGAPDPTEDTYRGQLLKRQSALGILAPSQQSKAKAKVCWLKQHLKIAQKMWPPERFAYLRSRFGEEWKDQDIEAFLSADLDKVLKIGYAEGSEIPTTLVEREQKLGAFLAQLLEALPVLQQAGEFRADILRLVSRYAELSGVDIDIADSEGDERLAKSRLDAIKQGLQELQQSVPPQDLMAVLFSYPKLQVLANEDHEAHVEFWSDRQRAEMAEVEPDFQLVGCYEEMIRRHEEAASAPIVAQAQAEADAAEVERDRMQRGEQEQRAGESAEKEKDRAHQAGMKQMELQSRERTAQRPRA